MASYPLIRKSVLFITAVLLLSVGFFTGTMVNFSPVGAQTTVPTDPDIATLDLDPQERQLAELYERISPSVVSIRVVSQLTGSSRTPSDLLPQDEFGYSFGSGSGFVIDAEGHIVTNNHVIDGASSIEISFFDGTITRAAIVGVDPDSDLAILKVDLPAERLTPVTFGDSASLVPGQTALALGSPFGQKWTLTRGIISALDRTISGLGQFSVGSVIQTDAAINPGNSGGPLLNLRGEVIGVNTQIFSQVRSNSGVGLAVPSNLVQRVVGELLEKGYVSYSYLGITGEDVTLQVMETMDLPNNIRGVVVRSIVTGAPAHKAGLRQPTQHVVVDGFRVPSQADIIVAINGTPVSSMNGLISYLGSYTRPGDVAEFSVWRDGEIITLNVTLEPRPSA